MNWASILGKGVTAALHRLWVRDPWILLTLIIIPALAIGAESFHRWRVQQIAEEAAVEAVKEVVEMPMRYPPRVDTFDDGRFSVTVWFQEPIHHCTHTLVTHSFAETEGSVSWSVTNTNGGMADGDRVWNSRKLPLPFHRDPGKSYDYTIDGQCIVDDNDIRRFKAVVERAVPIIMPDGL